MCTHCKQANQGALDLTLSVYEILKVLKAQIEAEEPGEPLLDHTHSVLIGVNHLLSEAMRELGL